MTHQEWNYYDDLEDVFEFDDLLDPYAEYADDAPVMISFEDIASDIEFCSEALADHGQKDLAHRLNAILKEVDALALEAQANRSAGSPATKPAPKVELIKARPAATKGNK